MFRIFDFVNLKVRRRKKKFCKVSLCISIALPLCFSVGRGFSWWQCRSSVISQTSHGWKVCHLLSLNVFFFGKSVILILELKWNEAMQSVKYSHLIVWKPFKTKLYRRSRYLERYSPKCNPEEAFYDVYTCGIAFLCVCLIFPLLNHLKSNLKNNKCSLIDVSN